MKNFLPETSPFLEPKNRLAKGLIIALSLVLMGLLFFVAGFVYREFLLEIFISQTSLESLIQRDEYLEMWKASLRFDAKLAYLMIVPGLLFAVVGMLGGGIYRYCCKLATIYVAHMFGWFYLSNTANVYFMKTTGRPLGSPEFEAFKAHPFDYIATFWPDYPILSTIVIGTLIGFVFVTFWLRLAIRISRWSIWHSQQPMKLAIPLLCFAGFMSICAQSSLTCNDPLDATKATFSQHPMLNAIAVATPMAIYYDEDLRKLGYFNPLK